MIRNLILLLMLLMISTHGAMGIVQCSDGMKLFQLADGSYDCLTCIVCPNGTLMTKECTEKHDTVCNHCYKSGFVGENETTCANCSVCKPGTFVERNCTKFENTVCNQCENGTFSDTFNAGSCKNCSSCEEQISACNQSSDTVCKDRRYFDVIDVILLFIDVLVHLILISTCICIYKQHQSVQQMRSDKGNGAASLNQEALVLMTEGNKDSESTSSSSSLEKLMPSVGTLILKVRGRIVQTNAVFRVGSKYVMTAYHSLAEYVELEFKLLVDEAYVTFDADPDDPSAVRNKICTNTSAYFNEHFDILVLEIVQSNILLKPNIPKPINSFCIDICKDTKLHFIDPALNVKESKWFQADIIANDKVLDTPEYLKDEAAFNKKKLSDSMKRLYDKCTADAENTDGQWLFWKYDVSLRSGSPGFIRDTDGELKLCCMNTAHFSKLCGTLSQKEYNFPEKYLLCTGIKMSAVYEDMNRKYGKLAKDIFGSLDMAEDAGFHETMTSESMITLHDMHVANAESTVDDSEGMAKPNTRVRDPD